MFYYIEYILYFQKFSTGGNLKFGYVTSLMPYFSYPTDIFFALAFYFWDIYCWTIPQSSMESNWNWFMGKRQFAVSMKWNIMRYEFHWCSATVDNWAPTELYKQSADERRSQPRGTIRRRNNIVFMIFISFFFSLIYFNNFWSGRVLWFICFSYYVVLGET